MKFLNKKIGLVAISVLLSIMTFSAYAGCPYRTYNLNSNCQYYYIDADGNMVLGGKYAGWKYKNFPLHKDCCGRAYYVDAWGNKMYVSKRCCGRTGASM